MWENSRGDENFRPRETLFCRVNLKIIDPSPFRLILPHTWMVWRGTLWAHAPQSVKAKYPCVILWRFPPSLNANNIKYCFSWQKRGIISSIKWHSAPMTRVIQCGCFGLWLVSCDNAGLWLVAAWLSFFAWWRPQDVLARSPQEPALGQRANINKTRTCLLTMTHRLTQLPPRILASDWPDWVNAGLSLANHHSQTSDSQQPGNSTGS